MRKAKRIIKRSVALMMCLTMLLDAKIVNAFESEKSVVDNETGSESGLDTLNEFDLPDVNQIIDGILNDNLENVTMPEDIDAEDASTDEELSEEDSEQADSVDDYGAEENVTLGLPEDEGQEDAGLITDEDENGISDVSVFVWSYSDQQTVGWYRTDESGNWECDEFEDGNRYRITYYHRDYLFDESVFDITAGETYDLSATGELIGTECEDSPIEDFGYEETDDGNIVITGYLGSDDTVKIPSEIDGCVVTSISSGAFKDKSSIEKVIFPDGITNIEARAFENCTALNEVYLGAGLQSIGDYAFSNCTSLSEINLPNNLLSIGQNAFAKCSFDEIYIPDSTENVYQRAFYQCKNLIDVNYPLSLKQDGKNLSGGAFDSCKLTEVLIPDGVKYIAPYYYSQSSVSSICFPDSLDEIGKGAFQGCVALTEVTLPDSLKKIGNSAFNGCANIETISINDTLEYIGIRAFRGCEKIDEIKLPDSVKTIDFGAFQNCKKLNKINYPKNLDQSEAGTDYFYGNEGLFDGCIALETIDIPYGVTNICSQVFRGAKSLKNITLPATVSSIGKGAFTSCESLTFLYIPEGVNVINANTFRGCNKLESVKLKSVASIGESAFSGCYSLVRLDADTENLTSIEDAAFKNCEKLEAITLTEKLTKLGTEAFSNCGSITIYAPKYSYAMYKLIDQNIKVIPTSEERFSTWSESINTEESSYRTSFSSNAASGTLAFTLDYSLNESIFNRISKTGRKEIAIYEPYGTQINADTVMLNKQKIISPSISRNHVLTIPITEPAGRITFSAKRTEAGATVVSYALFNYYIGGEHKDIIDVIIDNPAVITLEAPDTISNNTLDVYGYAEADSKVNLYVDEVLLDSVYSNKAGIYEKRLILDSVNSKHTYDVKAELDSNSQYFAKRSFKYVEGYPRVNKFIMRYAGKEYDLINDNPGIVVHYPNKGFEFDIGFEHVENVKEAYVVSTKHNKKKRIKAEWDENLRLFVIRDGFFAPPRERYGPGAISVEFSTKDSSVLSFEETQEEINRVIEEYSDELASVTRTETSTTEGTEAFEGYQVEGKEYNASTTNDQGDTVTFQLLEQRITPKPPIPPIPPDQDCEEISLDDIALKEGVPVFETSDNSGNRYRMAVVTKNPYKLKSYIEKTGTDGQKELIQYVCSLYLGGVAKPILEECAPNLLGLSAEFMSAYGELGLFKEFFENLANYRNDLSTIDNSDELTNEQKEQARIQLLAIFSARTLTAVAIFTLGSGAGLPVVIMLAVAGVILNHFWDLCRESTLNGEIFKAFTWIHDPSGYVYDVVTGDRLLNVETTLYCVLSPGDDDTFFDSPPSGDGEKWDATPYSQVNPLYTDIEGNYAWNVPEGWWKVEYKLDGYETAYSEWLPVPPPQLDVNIGLTPVSKKVSDGVYSYTAVTPQVFTGSKICPSIDLEYDGSPLIKDKDYKVAYRNNTNVGTAFIDVTGIGNFKKSSTNFTIKFDIVERDLSDSDIVVTVADKPYTGKEVISKPTVKYGKLTLREGKDYKISFNTEDRVNAGTVRMEITGIGNYQGTVNASYKIFDKKQDISKATISKISDRIYPGSKGGKITPDDFVVTMPGVSEPLEKDVDYSIVSYKNNENVGTATVVITGIGAYYGFGNTKSATFRIVQKDIKNAVITVTGDTTYTSKALKPSIEVRDDDTGEVISPDNYTVSYQNNTNVAVLGAKAQPVVKITGKKNYKGTASKEFVIEPLELTGSDVTVTMADVKEPVRGLTNKDIKPTVMVGNKKLTADKDYTVIFEKNESSKEQTVKVKFKGNYDGEAVADFMIYTGKINVSDLDINLSEESYVYTGAKIVPSVTVRCGDKLLIEGRDYKLVCSNNTKAAGALDKAAPSVKVSGLGAYTGTSKPVKFTIDKKTFTEEEFVLDVANAKFTGNVVKPSVSVRNSATGKKLAASDYKVTYINNTNIGEMDSESAPMVTVNGNGNYTGTLSANFRIYEKDINTATAIKVENEAYTGKQICPSKDQVVLYADRAKTVKLKEGDDYILSYGENIKAGRGTVVVTGIGEYGGSKTLQFTIVPKFLEWLLL